MRVWIGYRGDKFLKLKFKWLDNIILWLIIGQVVVFRYFNVFEIANKIILSLIVIRIMIYCILNKKIVGLSKKSYSILLVFFIIVANGLIYGVNDFFRSNVLMVLYPLIDMLYLTWYIKKYQEYFYLKLYKLRYLINIYFLINIVVMFIQLQGNYFMIGVMTQKNDMYEDLVSGLLGYSMVAAVCYFSVFVILYNFVIAETIRKKVNKCIFQLYNVILLGIMAYISIQNDNVQYFAVIAIALFFMMLVQKPLNTFKRIKTICCIGAFGIIVILVALKMIPGLYDILNSNVFYKFSGALEHMFDGAAVTHGSMERLALIVYGILHANGLLVGKGLSYAGVYTPYTFGFVHFGNANIGAFICLGGIWFYLTLIYCYSSRIVSMIQFSRKDKNTLLYGIIISILFVVASMFSIPFTEVSISLCVVFIMIVFGFERYINDLKG